MATDYDAPRKNDDDSTDSIEALKERRPASATSSVDDDADNPGDFDLSGADLSDVELETVVLPPQEDEFTCMNCFLVKHRSQLDHAVTGGFICIECAAQGF